MVIFKTAVVPAYSSSSLVTSIQILADSLLSKNVYEDWSNSTENTGIAVSNEEEEMFS